MVEKHNEMLSKGISPETRGWW